MAFKKREYNFWFKTLREALFKLGNNPYWFKKYWHDVFLQEENYEGMKATNDVFDDWFQIYKMSEKEVEVYFDNLYKHHPVYGDGYLPELKCPYD